MIATVILIAIGRLQWTMQSSTCYLVCYYPFCWDVRTDTAGY